jgi:hypothetical protein
VLQTLKGQSRWCESSRPRFPGPEEVNMWESLYTLLLCLPAALVLIACGCGVAVLWPVTPRPADHPTAAKRRGEKH